jgi:hypothetical protein
MHSERRGRQTYTNPQEWLQKVTLEEEDGKQTHARANTFATLLVGVA